MTSPALVERVVLAFCMEEGKGGEVEHLKNTSDAEFQDYVRCLLKLVFSKRFPQPSQDALYVPAARAVIVRWSNVSPKLSSDVRSAKIVHAKLIAFGVISVKCISSVDDAIFPYDADKFVGRQPGVPNCFNSVLQAAFNNRSEGV